LPLSDRRLLILEEVKNLDTDKIGALKEVRSSGTAEVTAIRRDRTSARARLIWNTNPRGSKKVENFNYGIECARELVGDPENISRFDYVVMVADNPRELSPELMLTGDEGRDPESARYTSDPCRDVLMFSWSRKSDEVLFDSQAQEAIIEYSRTFANTYDDSFPLVQAADFRYKLARVAAAIGARLFSVDRSGNSLCIKSAHVDAAAQFLEDLFRKASFGYYLYSKDQRRAKILKDEDEVKDTILDCEYADSLMENLSRASVFNRTQVAAWAGLDKPDASDMMNVWMRNRAILPYDHSRYKKTPAFISLLREMQNT